MNGIEIVLAVVGTIITLLVLAGMVLLVPRGVVEIDTEDTDTYGSSSDSAMARPRRQATTGVARRQY